MSVTHDSRTRTIRTGDQAKKGPSGSGWNVTSVTLMDRFDLLERFLGRFSDPIEELDLRAFLVCILKKLSRRICCLYYMAAKSTCATVRQRIVMAQAEGRMRYSSYSKPCFDRKSRY